jgi:hypothetical protein
MKTYGGSGCIAPYFLDLSTSWRWVVSFTPRPLYPRYPLYRRLGGPQSQSGWLEKWKFLTLPGLELNPLVIQPIASRYTNYTILAPRDPQYHIILPIVMFSCLTKCKDFYLKIGYNFFLLTGELRS